MQIQTQIISTPTDLAKAFEIRTRVFVEEQGVPKSMELDEFEDQSVHFLATFEGRAVGTGRLRAKGDFVKFERIATLPEARGKGVGKRILESMEVCARDRFPALLPMMHAQDSAVSFYREKEWDRIGEAFEEAGILHWILVKVPADPGSLNDLAIFLNPDADPVFLKYLRER